MAVTDLDEWLHPEAAREEVALEVDDPARALVLRATLAVTPAGRWVELSVVSGVAGRSSSRAEEAGPPPTNWDRMRIGPVEWRMIEPLRRWDLSVDDGQTGLRAYLTFSGTGACTALPDGYEQRGTVSGDLQLADLRVTVTEAPARRSHTWT